jgi:hypothetical protein
MFIIKQQAFLIYISIIYQSHPNISKYSEKRTVRLLKSNISRYLSLLAANFIHTIINKIYPLIPNYENCLFEFFSKFIFWKNLNVGTANNSFINGHAFTRMNMVYNVHTEHSIWWKKHAYGILQNTLHYRIMNHVWNIQFSQ